MKCYMISVQAYKWNNRTNRIIIITSFVYLETGRSLCNWKWEGNMSSPIFFQGLCKCDNFSSPSQHSREYVDCRQIPYSRVTYKWGIIKNHRTITVPCPCAFSHTGLLCWSSLIHTSPFKHCHSATRQNVF